MNDGLGFGRRKVIDEIIKQSWGLKDEHEKKAFTYLELLYIIQQLSDQEGKAYQQGGGHKHSIMRGYNVFREFVQLLLYRNIANYDSMLLISSEKGTGKSSAAIMIARYWCKLLGIRFSPERHIAYNNADVMRKIDNLNKFEPIICLPGNTYIRIKCNGKECNEVIRKLVDRNDFDVLTYNIKEDKFEWKKPGKVILTKEDIVDTIELENGIRIQATSNHLFLTKDGIYKRVDELTENDELVLNTKKCKVCNKEYFNQFQYSLTCSKECENKNRASIIYRITYPEKSRLYYKNRFHKKFRNDIAYRLRHNLGTRIFKYIKGMKSEKGKDKIAGIIGCSLNELKQHLEKQFTEGMTWDNYGNGKNKWSVDHIIPLCKFDYNNKEDFIKAMHYTNIQPLQNSLNCGKGRWTK